MGGQRRERTARTKSRHVIDAKQSKEDSRRLRDVVTMLTSTIKKARNRKATGREDPGASLISIIKNISEKSDELQERKQSKRGARKKGLELLTSRRHKSMRRRALQGLIGGMPAIAMTAFVAANVFETTKSAQRRVVRSEQRFSDAQRDRNLESAELILRKRLTSDRPDALEARLRYAKLLLDSGQFDRARRYTRATPFDGSERSGDLQTIAAQALNRFGITDDSAAAEYESRLVIAIADPATSSKARAMLGRFYRERGQFEACESVLEPIRASEQGCLELALLRDAQGQYGDIPTTLAPYLVRWRERWLDPKSFADIDSSAEALILMNQESVVLETLDDPPVPVAPDALARIRTMAAKSLMDRAFRSGKLRYAEALDDLKRHFDRLPFSIIWVEPLIKLSAIDSPIREEGIATRNAIALEKPCPVDFLNALARQAIKTGDTEFALQLAETSMARFPDDPETREIQADLLIKATPPDLKRVGELIDPVIRDHPERGDAFEIRGKLREAQNQFAEALADYRTAMLTAPRNPVLHESIARVSQRLGDDGTFRIHSQIAQELRKPK